MDALRLFAYVLTMLFIWYFLIPFTFKLDTKNFHMTSAMFALECGVFIILFILALKVALHFALGVVHGT